MPTKSTDAPQGEPLDLPDLPVSEGEDLSHPLLSPEEVAKAKADARAKFQALQKKQAMDALVKAEMDRLRGPAGLVTGDPVRDELVTLSLDLAEHSDGIMINGEKFWHGHTYTVPRHVADSLREMQARGHNHQNEIEGKGIADRFRRPQLTVLNGITGAVHNAPQRMG